MQCPISISIVVGHGLLERKVLRCHRKSCCRRDLIAIHFYVTGGQVLAARRSISIWTDVTDVYIGTLSVGGSEKCGAAALPNFALPYDL